MRGERTPKREEQALKKGSKKVWLGLTIFFLLICVFSIGFLIYQEAGRRRAGAEMEALVEAVNESKAVTVEPEPIQEPVLEDSLEEEVNPEEELLPEPELTLAEKYYERYGITLPEKELDWDALHEENADIYAWITVPDTTVDYPILQSATDNEYYLNHNLDGSTGFPGVIYTENYNSKDFTDPNTVVYGHNLKDKTMFSSLHNFETPDLVSTPHYIYIYTEEGETLVYEIFAAYEFPSIHLLLNYDLSNEYVYEQYLKDIFNASKYGGVVNLRDDIQLDIDDRIITLSTCTSDHDASERFLVVGYLLNIEE